MIAFVKTRNNKYLAFGTGVITVEPSYKTVGGKDTPLCSFFISADKTGSGATAEYDSYLINAWNDLAAYASNFEKRDKIFVFGECKRNEYLSKKNGRDEFTIDADLIAPANFGVLLLQLMQMISELNASGRDSSNGTATTDLLPYSDVELPAEFEPTI